MPTVAPPTVQPLILPPPAPPISAQQAWPLALPLTAYSFQGQQQMLAVQAQQQLPMPFSSTQQQFPPQHSPVARGLSSSFGQRDTYGFVGRPVSADIVGAQLATCEPPRDGCSYCKGVHWSFECPLAYYARYQEPCPGFDSQGSRIPDAWTQGEITSTTKAGWRDYIARHLVPLANRGPAGRVPAVDFS